MADTGKDMHMKINEPRYDILTSHIDHSSSGGGILTRIENRGDFALVYNQIMSTVQTLRGIDDMPTTNQQILHGPLPTILNGILAGSDPHKNFLPVKPIHKQPKADQNQICLDQRSVAVAADFEQVFVDVTLEHIRRPATQKLP